MRYRKPVILLAAALLTAAAPLRADWSHGVPQLFFHEAAAKEGGRGNGREGGGDKGDNGKNGDNGRNGNHGRAVGRSGAKSADSVVAKVITKDSVRIRYRNGYREQVAKGRFVMKDAKGRTVIDRRATTADRIRLWLKEAIP